MTCDRSADLRHAAEGVVQLAIERVELVVNLPVLGVGLVVRPA